MYGPEVQLPGKALLRQAQRQPDPHTDRHTDNLLHRRRNATRTLDDPIGGDPQLGAVLERRVWGRPVLVLGTRAVRGRAKVRHLVVHGKLVKLRAWSEDAGAQGGVRSAELGGGVRCSVASGAY